MSDAAAAHRALAKAEEKITAATAERDEASAALARALAARGWRRLIGAFAAGAEPLYENAAGEVFGRGAVVDYELERERAAA